MPSLDVDKCQESLGCWQTNHHYFNTTSHGTLMTNPVSQHPNLSSPIYPLCPPISPPIRVPTSGVAAKYEPPNIHHSHLISHHPWAEQYWPTVLHYNTKPPADLYLSNVGEPNTSSSLSNFSSFADDHAQKKTMEF